jgi:hypothetical protein
VQAIIELNASEQSGLAWLLVICLISGGASALLSPRAGFR